MYISHAGRRQLRAAVSQTRGIANYGKEKVALPYPVGQSIGGSASDNECEPCDWSAWSDVTYVLVVKGFALPRIRNHMIENVFHFGQILPPPHSQ